MNLELIEASLEPPVGLAEMLLELGSGESGFSGTPFSTAEMTLLQYLQSLVDMSQGRNLSPGYVPQTTYWLAVNGELVGILRLRHQLNSALRKKGGHIGYYMRPSARGKGYAKAALAKALSNLAAKGVSRALITTDADNTPSIHTIVSQGGVLAEGVEDDSPYHRYWIELAQ